MRTKPLLAKARLPRYVIGVDENDKFSYFPVKHKAVAFERIISIPIPEEYRIRSGVNNWTLYVSAKYECYILDALPKEKFIIELIKIYNKACHDSDADMQFNCEVAFDILRNYHPRSWWR